MDEEQENLVDLYSPKQLGSLPIPDGLHKCTKALFYEFRHQCTASKYPAQYTLKEQNFKGVDGVTYQSMYQIYMKCDSEYQAAITLLGSMSHWNKLKQSPWFAPLAAEWEAERNLRDEAVARTLLMEAAKAGNVTASSTIFKNSKAAGTGKVGRPAKPKAEKNTDSTVDEMLKIAGKK